MKQASKFMAVVALSATLLCSSVWMAGATSSDDLDIGSPQQTGGTSFSSGVYTISGGGADIWNTSDQFHYNKGALAGNGTVTAYVKSVGNTDPWAKAGVMLRNTVNASSADAAVFVTPGQGVTFQYRAVGGGSTAYIQVKGVTAPVWVRLHRVNSSFAGSYSANGTNWYTIGASKKLTMNPTVLAGAAVCAHNTGALCVSTFSDIAVTPDVDARYVHTQGNSFCDAKNNRVTLRGTNIGGWLVTEGWMCGQSDNGGRFALEQLETRFGTAQAAGSHQRLARQLVHRPRHGQPPKLWLQPHPRPL